MSIEPVNDTGISLDPSKRPDADRQQIKRLAQEFEAMLMTQMLREMRQSMVEDDESHEDGFGAAPLTDTADAELGRSLSASGGLGLADSLLKAFERQIAGLTGQTGQPAQVGQAGPTGLDGPVGRVGKDEPAVSQSASAMLMHDITAAAPVSSKFGWRQDPLTGVAQFHQGVDIAVAYGRDVKAAADGTVSFAGVQNGYGNTVVIDHEGGRQTRYAHLSQPLVQAGDVVSEGQVVGKSGNSGRSTGPHLHFEMLVNGRPIDPATVAE